MRGLQSFHMVNGICCDYVLIQSRDILPRTSQTMNLGEATDLIIQQMKNMGQKYGWFSTMKVNLDFSPPFVFKFLFHTSMLNVMLCFLGFLSLVV